MKKLLTVLLTVMIAFTTFTVNVFANQKTLKLNAQGSAGTNLNFSFDGGTNERTAEGGGDSHDSSVWTITSDANDVATLVSTERIVGFENTVIFSGPGTVTITANVVKSDGGGEKSGFSWTIIATQNKTKATPATVTAAKTEGKDTLIYNGEPQTLVSVDDTNLTAGAAMKYAVTGTSITDAPTEGWDDEVPQGKDAGAYRVWYYADATEIDDTHTDSDKTYVDVEIAKDTLTLGVSIVNWSVGGTPSTPDVTGNTYNATVTYKYKTKDADDSTYSDDVPTTKGEYTLKATVEGTDNYNSASATCNFSIVGVEEINIKDVDLKDEDKKFEYTGKNINPEIVGLEEVCHKETRHGRFGDWEETVKDYSVSYLKKTGEKADEQWLPTANCKDVGDYKVVITLNSGWKFVETEEPAPAPKPEPKAAPAPKPEPGKKDDKELVDSQTLTIKFKVEKAELEPSLRNPEVTYNGLRQNPTINGLWQVGRNYTVEYYQHTGNGDKLDKDYTKVNNCVEVGDYKVIVYLSESAAKNYKLKGEKGGKVELTYTIKKATVSASLVGRSTVEWSNNLQNPSVVVKLGRNNIDKKYFEIEIQKYYPEAKVDKDKWKKVETANEVGEYRIIVKLTGEGKKLFEFEGEKPKDKEEVVLDYKVVPATLAKPVVNPRNPKANLGDTSELNIANLDSYPEGTTFAFKEWTREGLKDITVVVDEDGSFELESGSYVIVANPDENDENHKSSEATWLYVAEVSNEDEDAYSIDSLTKYVGTEDITIVCDYQYVEYSQYDRRTREMVKVWDNLKSVVIDGEELREGVDYTVVSNSTDVTLSEAYAKALKVGKHSVEFHYEDGLHVEGTLNIVNRPTPDTPAKKYVAPKTGVR